MMREACKMKKKLRNEYNQPIELSDLNNKDQKTPSKVIEKDYATKKTEKKNKVKNKELVKNVVTKSKNIKAIKRKTQEESPGTSTKKSKLAISSFINSTENLYHKNLAKDGDKYNINISLNSSFAQYIEWTDVDYISEINNVDKHIARNIVKLFKEDNTIPFLARYRKDIIGYMGPDQLRACKDSFEQAKIIKHRAATIIKAIDKLGKWTPEIHSIITSTKSLADLEDIYSLFKPTLKRSLAERARELGLESISEAILQGQKISSLVSLIDEKKEGLQSEEQVKDGIVHIIADIISKDKEVFDKVISLRKIYIMDIQTIQCKTAVNPTNKTKNALNRHKYEIYFNFKANERNIKPHQILAINRAESQKILNIKIIIPNTFEQAFKKFCTWRYALAAKATNLNLFGSSIDYIYKKLIKPLITRRVKVDMKKRAEIASIEVFATNVKQLLLASPIRGKIILGIDPGFHHGCKLAVVSEHGDVLDTAVIYPHKSSKKSYEQSVNILVNLINKYKCTILALGNATACRETELFLTKIIKSNMFDSLKVSYTIVDEAGASIYSCSPEAKSEFPNLDLNLVSAISIARRLQDPLAELVKIEPKHLGVGMYQHDLPEKQLMNSLDEVVTEAVSFVGVDINTASECLLRRVAGLTSSKAANIIEWRIKHGAFKSREQLLNVKGIGSKTFEQCAGFIRILPETAMANENLVKDKKSKNFKSNLNLLDQTWIHPESYMIANKFLKHCQCNLEQFGTSAFIEKINSYAEGRYAELATQFDTNEATMEIIVKGLTMRKNEDIRAKSNYPLFHNGIQDIDDLSIGTILNGVVRNVTHFGAFVDVGVGKNGLIHIIYLKDHVLYVGQRVEVKVLSVERVRNRISLELVRTL